MNDDSKVDPISWEDPTRNRVIDVEQRLQLLKLIESSGLNDLEKIKCFPRFIQTTYIRKFISRLKIYELSIESTGSIVECGVLGGDGLLSWGHFVEIFEPYNHLRRVVGFDSFDGFPKGSLSPKDEVRDNEQLRDGGLKSSEFEEISESIRVFDLNRPLSHIQRVSVVKGDARETISKFLAENPEFLISLLWLDFDIYEPTKIALREFLPRMHAGSIVAFDELSHPLWPGETIAALEEMNLRRYEIRRFPFGSTVSYIQLR